MHLFSHASLMLFLHPLKCSVIAGISRCASRCASFMALLQYFIFLVQLLYGNAFPKKIMRRYSDIVYSVNIACSSFMTLSQYFIFLVQLLYENAFLRKMM